MAGDFSDPTRASGFVLEWHITDDTIVMTARAKYTGVHNVQRHGDTLGRISLLG